jgi:hypothetical protein
VLFTNPLNIFTWPHIAQQCIRILSYPFSPPEIATFLNSAPLQGDMGLKYEILCLLFNHPLIDVFLITKSIESADSKDDVRSKTALNKAVAELLSFRNDFTNQMSSADHIPSLEVRAFCAKLRQIFKTLIESVDTESLVMYAEEIARWFDGLLERKKLGDIGFRRRGGWGWRG